MNYHNDVLLEIESEELPFSCIMAALNQIKDFMLKKFETDYKIKCHSFQIYATSRKLILIITNLQYTKTKKQTLTLLSKIFIDLIHYISFYKTMIWNKSKFKFARPIRNIVAIYGKQIIKFKVAGISSSKFSNINIYKKNKIKIDLPKNYVSYMKHNFIIVDQNKRYKLLKYMIKRLLVNIGTIVYSERLLNEMIYLVDYPYPILCSFNAKYLHLPTQILRICINNQKCFAVLNKSNILSNFFICVINRNLKKINDTTIIKNGYERVMDSTLSDASYFYNSDVQSKVITNLDKLKSITFHNKIGSIYEKVERMKKIATLFNKEFFDMKINNRLLKRAIELTKTDILSKIVFEYPELQGIAGKIYALKLGENTDIANSIEQHYWPINANSDKLPLSIISIIISLTDRIDTLVSSFAVGIFSSGSTDPYGLRRLCIGFLKIMKKYLIDISLDRIIQITLSFNNNKDVMSSISYNKLIDFFKQRLNFMLKQEGHGLKEIQTVLNISTNTIGSLSILYNKLNALNNFIHHEQFKNVLLIFKRINNFLKQALKNKICITPHANEKLFIHNSERILYNKIKKFNIRITDYTKFFNDLIKLSVIINDFFSKVMVMSNNVHIKQNRLSLLNSSRHLFTDIIDLSLYLQNIQ
jgi:glycyl-tRNA synthetase beta chain